MFSDSLWPNVILFVLAQIVAWGFLRTGLLVRGMALMASAWIGADVALLARFVWGETGVVYWLPLLVFQLHTVVETLLFAFGRWRRRSKAFVARRREVYREAFVHYLKDELEPARQRWRRLAWSDPWDLESALGWATVLVRQGRTRRARMLLTQARWLDRDEKFRDVIDEELGRCRSSKGAAKAAKTPKKPSKTEASVTAEPKKATESASVVPVAATDRVRATPAKDVKEDPAKASEATPSTPAEPAVTLQPVKPPEGAASESASVSSESADEGASEKDPPAEEVPVIQTSGAEAQPKESKAQPSQAPPTKAPGSKGGGKPRRRGSKRRR